MLKFIVLKLKKGQLMIKCKTEVKEGLIMQFNMYSARRKLWFPFAAFAFLLIIGIVCCFDEQLGIVAGIIIICIGAVLPLVYWIGIIFLVKKSVTNSSLLKSQMTQNFTFDDKIYINESSKFVKANDMEFAWEMLFKAIEVDNSFYLYINKVQAFIIDKSGFSEGSPSDLHAILAERLPAKRFKFSKRLYLSK